MVDISVQEKKGTLARFKVYFQEYINLKMQEKIISQFFWINKIFLQKVFHINNLLVYAEHDTKPFVDISFRVILLTRVGWTTRFLKKITLLKLPPSAL